MLHEKVGKHGMRNRGRYQVAQSWLNRPHNYDIRQFSFIILSKVSNVTQMTFWTPKNKNLSVLYEISITRN